MYDAQDRFNQTSSPVYRRQVEKDTTGAKAFSPSYGVRHGYLADHERPLPQGVENHRQYRRIPMTFEVFVDGVWRQVAGDLSAGGALFLLPFLIRASEVQVRVRKHGYEWLGMGEIVGVASRGLRYGHHVQFAASANHAELDEMIRLWATQG